MKHGALALGLCVVAFTLLTSCPTSYFVVAGCKPTIEILHCELDDGSSTITSYIRVTNEGTMEIPRIDVNIVAHLDLKDSDKVAEFKYSGSAVHIPPGKSAEGIAIGNLRDPWSNEVDTTRTWQEVRSWEISQ